MKFILLLFVILIGLSAWAWNEFNQEEEQNIKDFKTINPSITFYNEILEKPSLTVYSKARKYNGTPQREGLYPPYYVTLHPERCQERTCDCAIDGCLAYCYVCDDDTQNSGGMNNG